jgi:hypothetical protein
MKTIFFKQLGYFLFITLFMVRCQKEPNLQKTEDNAQNLAQRKAKNECRLTNLSAQGGSYDYRYNVEGLAEDWDITDYGLFRQVYDPNGRLTISRLYADDELVYTIHFIYENNRVVDEIWYVGNTSQIDDAVHYTYNNKGLIERAESFIKDYYTINMFTPEGNTASFIFYSEGMPLFSASLTYGDRVKNPYLAVPGISYAFPFANSTYFTNKWWATSERLVFYDDNGEELVQFDYDASQTTWEIGHQDYPLSTTYFDQISNSSALYIFEYENCAPGNNITSRSTPAKVIKSAPGKFNPLGLVKRGVSKSVKEQVDELRMLLQAERM